MVKLGFPISEGSRKEHLNKPAALTKEEAGQKDNKKNQQERGNRETPGN